MIPNTILAEFEQLSTEEQILLVQDLWDRIAASRKDQPPLSEAQAAELEQRLIQLKPTARTPPSGSPPDPPPPPGP